MEIQQITRLWRLGLLSLMALGLSFLPLSAQVAPISPTFDDSLRLVAFDMKFAGKPPVPKDFMVDFQHNFCRNVVIAPSADSGTVSVKAELPKGIFPGPNLVQIRFRGKELWKDTLYIPNPQPNPDQQPMVTKVDPMGGFVGRAVALTGKNFGDNLNEIYVWLGDEEGHPYDADFNPVPASYLSSPDAQGNQEIRFYYPDIPQDLLHGEEKNPKFWLSRRHRMWVFVKGQPSATAKTINLVNSNYRMLVFLLTLGIFAVIGVVFWLIFRMRKGGNNPWFSMLLDGTNHFSLPKIQVFGWTLLLAFGYTYFALTRWLVMDDGSIPDFPSSLLILMGVTSGGALISMSQNNNDANRTWTDTPKIRDVVYEGEQLSLSKLQLILFTIIAMTLYITYLADDQLVFHGMPEVPTNLLLLMGISQGGAIAGKTVESTEATNMRNATASQQPSTPSAAPQPITPAPPVPEVPQAPDAPPAPEETSSEDSSPQDPPAS